VEILGGGGANGGGDIVRKREKIQRQDGRQRGLPQTATDAKRRMQANRPLGHCGRKSLSTISTSLEATTTTQSKAKSLSDDAAFPNCKEKRPALCGGLE
jgi:hypothetical protein